MPEKSKLLLHNPREWFVRRPKRRPHPHAWRQQLVLVIPAMLLTALVQWLTIQQFMTEPPALTPRLVLPEPLEYEFELPIAAIPPPPPPLPKPDPEPASESGRASAPQSSNDKQTSASASANAASASAASSAPNTPNTANTVDTSAQSPPVVSSMTPSSAPVAPSPLLNVDPPPPTPSATVNAPSTSEVEPLAAQTDEVAEEQARNVAGQGDIAADVAPMRALADVERTAPKPVVDIALDVPRTATYEVGGAPMPAEPLPVMPERVNPLRSKPNLALEAPTVPAIPVDTPMAANPLRAPIDKADLKQVRPALAVERNDRKPAPLAINAPAAAEPLSVRADASPALVSKPALVVDQAPRPAVAISSQTPLPGAAERVLTPDQQSPALRTSPVPAKADIAGQQNLPSIAAPAANQADDTAATAPATASNPSSSAQPSDPFSSNNTGPTGPVDLYGSATDAAKAIAGDGTGETGGGRGRARGFKKFNNPFADDSPNPLRGLRQREPQLFLDLAKYLVKTLGPGVLAVAVNANEEIDDSVGMDAGPLIERWIEAHHSDLKLECERRSDMPDNVRRLLCQQ